MVKLSIGSTDLKDFNQINKIKQAKELIEITGELLESAKNTYD